MRKTLYLVLLGILPLAISAQDAGTVDSLKSVIAETSSETKKVDLIIELASKFYMTAPESAIEYGTQAKEMAEAVNYLSGLAYAHKSIGMGYYFLGDYPKALFSWTESMETFKLMDDKLGVANMLNNLGAIYFNQGDDENALGYYLESLRYSEEINHKLRTATALVNIGAVYFNKEASHDLALKYYSRALPLTIELENLEAIGTVSVNMGEIFLERNDLDSAIIYFEIAYDAYRKSESTKVAYTLNNIGKVYVKKGEFDRAAEIQQEAYQYASDLDAKLEMAQSLIGLANTYIIKGNPREGVNAFLDAEKIAIELENGYLKADIYKGLADGNAALDDFGKAYLYEELYASMKDTLYIAERDEMLTGQMLNYEIDVLNKDKALQEADLRREKVIRNATIISGVLILLIALGLYNRYKYVRRTKKIIEGEKELSDKLLLNILPEQTAAELKETGTSMPKQYKMVSVLFTDFKGFTKIAEKLTPFGLVEELNQCFLAFDKIIDKYNLEKIKTIGDAYMCAGGIPMANETNPIDTVRAALEIREFMEALKKDRESRGEDYWELRIGIHTGPVIAGVVGKNKFAYDIWGDAVNTASRMESSGIPGKVNISGTTYELVKDHFECTHRGKIQAKNKGEIDMYIVEGVSTSESKDMEPSSVTSNSL